MRLSVVLVATCASTLLPGICAAQTWGQPAAQPAAPAAPSPGLEAGGLRPPGSQPAPADRAPGETEQQLAEADREDSGRGLEFFWMGGEAGFQLLGLHALSGGELIDTSELEASQSGLVYGGGLGVRLVFVTLGARFRYSPFPDWEIWTLGAEAGLRIPLGSLEPYFTLGGGYASVGAIARSGGAGASGLDVRAGGGLDWYASGAFSIGAHLDGELLILSRSAISGAPGIYGEDASSVGAGFSATAVAGLHF